jgi:hypothetical protein
MKVPSAPPVGFVIAYEFLWESQAGDREDGAKTYPAGVVMARKVEASATIAYVLGISHRQPQPGERALQLPPKLKRYLGLDEEPSWIYTDQLNVFTWPGPDLRPAERLSTRRDAAGTCVIAPLPSDWFEIVKDHLLESRHRGLVAAIKRST